MKLEIASANNNQELIQFFGGFPTEGLIDLKIDRSPDFFAPYRLQSDQFRTYILRDEEKKSIEATASFVIKDVFYEGKMIKIAYATDLRVSSSRRAILEWTHHFLPVMKDISNTLNVAHIFSMINMTEFSAMNTFLRPRNMRRPLPRYFLYRKFNITTLHGRFPWAKPPLTSLRIREGSSANLDALITYITNRNQFRPFSSVWDAKSFHDKMSKLTDFKLSDFLITFDSKDNIIGCVAPWSSRSSQKLIPLSYSLQAHNFRQFLKFGKLFNWTRPLAKPATSRKKENILNFKWLTNLIVNNEDVFESLLWTAYERSLKTEFLAYVQIEQDFRILPPQSWVSAKIPYAMYAVLPPEQDAPAFLHPNIVLNPEIEGAFI